MPTVAVSAIAVLLGAAVGLPPGRIALLGAAILAGQLSIGWSNDRLDAARDGAAGRPDKPAAAGAVPLRAVTAAAAGALGAAVVLSALLGRPAAIALLTLVAAGWAYNLGLKSTIWSGLTYAVGFGALPCAAYLARAGHPGPPWWAPVTGALLGLAAHLANALPDLAADAATGVRGLPHRLGARRCALVLAATLLAASVVLAANAAGAAIAVAAVGLAGAAAAVTAAAWRPASPWAFRLTALTALLDVTALLVLASR